MTETKRELREDGEKDKEEGNTVLVIKTYPGAAELRRTTAWNKINLHAIVSLLCNTSSFNFRRISFLRQ